MPNDADDPFVDPDSGELTGIHFVGCGCDSCCNRDLNETQTPTLSDPSSTSSAQASETLFDMAEFLRSGYWNGVSRKYNLNETGLNANSGVLEFNMTRFSNKLGLTDINGITNDRKDLVREAFKIYEAVLGVQFVETTSSDADFFFADAYDGAFAGSTGFTTGIEYSVINVADTWSGGTSTYNDYTLQTIFHEIGHALGLGHQGPYNGQATYSNDAQFAKDSWQATMMSYFSQTQNTAILADFEFLQTPMAVDWIALGDIYGNDVANGQSFGVQNAFFGDTVYGFNTNITSAVSDIWSNFSSFADETASTIIDAGGIDTLDVSGYNSDQNIDLTVVSRFDTVLRASDIGGREGNLTLAEGTLIENATGGVGNDSFVGNAAANVFRGNAGSDIFVDSAGNDSYFGGAGTDTVSFAFDLDGASFNLVAQGLEVLHEAGEFATDFVDSGIETLSFAGTSISYADAKKLAEGPTPSLEIGSATVRQESADQWHSVAFGTQIADAVVVMGPITYNGNHAATTQVRNVTETGFEFQIDEFDYLDGVHTTETIGWIAVTGGRHEFGGLTLEAGDTTATDESFSDVRFGSAYASAPVVLAQLASDNDDAAAVTRVRSVSLNGFEVQMQEEELADGLHGAERVSWIAIEAGDGEIFDAALTGIAVTEQDTTVAFDTAEDTVFLAGLQTWKGKDTANVRLSDLTETSATFFLDEEQSRDNETSHVAERVGYLSATEGIWFA